MYGIKGNQTFAEYELDGDQVNSRVTLKRLTVKNVGF